MQAGKRTAATHRGNLPQIQSHKKYIKLIGRPFQKNFKKLLNWNFPTNQRWTSLNKIPRGRHLCYAAALGPATSSDPSLATQWTQSSKHPFQSFQAPFQNIASGISLIGIFSTEVSILTHWYFHMYNSNLQFNIHFKYKVLYLLLKKKPK